MRKNICIRSRLALLLTLSIIGLSGCNFPKKGPRTTPVPDVALAYPHVASQLTLATPGVPLLTNTPASTEYGLETSPIAIVPSRQPPTIQHGSSAPTVNCDQAGAGIPIDLSIPDDTPLLAGQAFTKVWRLQNVGGCTWTRDYKVALFSGEGMGAQPILPLPGDVPPGQTVEISVDMIAPQMPGKHQGNWKLRNPSNNWFGIGPNGSAPFWVRIVVKQPPPTAILTIPPKPENTH
jgi:hypothetical protein